MSQKVQDVIILVIVLLMCATVTFVALVGVGIIVSKLPP